MEHERLPCWPGGAGAHPGGLAGALAGTCPHHGVRRAGILHPTGGCGGGQGTLLPGDDGRPGASFRPSAPPLRRSAPMCGSAPRAPLRQSSRAERARTGGRRCAKG
ncbi:hypothetical protein DA2_0361 [Desulfovibrio sp. A2]|nr:hypothetical protein DA2_0361 [Desulfovibrio sp. A2]